MISFRSRLGCVAFACATLWGSASFAEDRTAAAREHFKTGIAFLEDPEGERFEEAYAEFEAAYDLSRSPKILGNIGLCAMKLERDGEAMQAYRRYLTEVPDIDPEERAQATRDLRTLSSSAVRLGISVPQPDAIIVDTRIPVRGPNVNNVYGAPNGRVQLYVRPGHHVVTVKVGGKDRERWEFTASGGEPLSHAFAAKDEAHEVSVAPAARDPMPWVLVGIGGAALVAGGVMGVLTLDKLDQLHTACPDKQCTTRDGADTLSSSRTMVTVTDTLLIGGGVLAGTGIVWLLAAPRQRSSSAANGGEIVAGGFCDGTGCFGTAGGAF